MTINNTTLSRYLVIACIVATIISLLPVPFHFYILIRLIFFVAGSWFAWQLFKLERSPIAGIPAFIALIFNPFILISLGSKLAWLGMDVIAVLVFVYASARIRKSQL